MTNTDVPNQLVLPVRAGAFDDPIWDAISRNFRALEDYLNSPHRVYGSRMIAPLFYEQDLTDEVDIQVRPKGSGAFSGGQWDGLVIQVDRPSRAFVWGLIEAENTDAADDYRMVFYLPVEITTIGTDNGVPVSHGLAHGEPREVISNFRMVDIPLTTPQSVTFMWAVQNSTGANQLGTIHRRKMIVACFDAPDADSTSDVPINWTLSALTKAAYLNPEPNEAN